MTLMMSQNGEKATVVEAPTYVVTSGASNMPSGSEKKGVQKKHVLILVGSIVLAGLVIAGILVGMRIFAEAQKEIIKFSLDFKSSADGQNVKQDVVSDPNDNSVMYNIVKDGKAVSIVNDFGREIQVVKMETEYGTNCYISALNRSASMDPSQITGPESKSNGNTSEDAVKFTMSTSPISDRSFLPKKALDMCKNVSVYWAYRSCGGESEDKSAAHGRKRRWVCKIGCGLRVCSCYVRLVQYREGGRLKCRFYASC